MHIFKEDELVYKINFEIITSILNKQCAGFLAKQIDTLSYKSSQVYSTKSEAIDAVIKELEKLKI